MSQTVCRRVIVTGRVQGVAFRAYARATAREAGVTGWVRNLPDGRVEALVEGDRERVDSMLAWLHKGPPAGRVDKVTVYEEKPTGQFTDFDITFTQGGYR